MTHSSCFHLKLINKYHYKWTQNLKQNSMETNHSKSFQNNPKERSFSNWWPPKKELQPSLSPWTNPPWGYVTDMHRSPVPPCWLLGMKNCKLAPTNALAVSAKQEAKFRLWQRWPRQRASWCFGQEPPPRKLTSETFRGLLELVHHCTAQWAAVSPWAALTPSPPRMLNRK